MHICMAALYFLFRHKKILIMLTLTAFHDIIIPVNEYTIHFNFLYMKVKQDDKFMVYGRAYAQCAFFSPYG